MRNHGPSAEAGDYEDRARRRRDGAMGACIRCAPARVRPSRARLRDRRHRDQRDAVDLFDWRPRFPVCLVFGHEVEGIRPEMAALCDTHVRIPMLGVKHSLNVATAGGVVIYELLRKYRAIGVR